MQEASPSNTFCCAFVTLKTWQQGTQPAGVAGGREDPFIGLELGGEEAEWE